MKFLLTVLLAIAAVSPALAKGTLMFQPTYDEKTKKNYPIVGLGIYETLFTDKVAFNSWTGMGNLPDYEMADGELSQKEYWMTTRNQLDFNFSKVTLSPGFQVLKTTDEKDWNRRLYVRLAVQLW